MRMTTYHTPDELCAAARAAGRVAVPDTGASSALVAQFLKAEGVCVTAENPQLTVFTAPAPDAPDAPDACIVSGALQDALAALVPVHLDFMCPGFAKCGTTTLQEVLIQDPDCYLPPAKETFFLQWYQKTPDATRVLRTRHYRRVRPGQKAGCIEPSHYNRAKDAFEYFGSGMKILFMVRNPAEAEFSYFRMLARNIYRDKHLDLFKTCRRFGPQMFDLYVEREVKPGYDKRFAYDRWISEYLKYFPKENVKVVLFEDMLKNPRASLDDIQTFLGLTPLPFGRLPHANEGKSVSRGYLAARVNLALFKIDEKLKSRPINRFVRFYQRYIKRAVFAFTLKKDDSKLTPEAKTALTAHFMPSIRRLETIIGRSLEGVWY